MPYTDFTGGSTRLTPDWFSGLASSLGDAIENRRAGRLLSDYVDSVWGNANPTANIDYAGGLGRPPSGGGTAPADYADNRVRQAFETIGEEGGATGRVIPERYRAFFETAGRQYGQDPAILARQAQVESGFNPNAVSPAGAIGISQFMPQTAARFGIDPRDPQQSIMAQAEYNALNRDRFGGNEGLTYAAYNWGEGNVAKWLANGADPSRMPAETRDYVQKITGRPIEAHLQGTQTAMGAAPVPGAGDRPGARPGAPTGFLGGYGAGQSDYPMPDRETLKAMARNRQLRPLVVDILKAQRSGADRLTSDMRDYLLAQRDPAYAAWLDRNRPPRADTRPSDVREYEYYAEQERAAGRTPDSFDEWRLAGKRAGVADAESEFVKETSKRRAQRFDEIVQGGANANTMIAQVQRLRDLGTQIGTGKGAEITAALGPFAESIGIDIEGLDEMQAYQAVTAAMAPSLRTPGSGAQSDFELRSFMQSLPSLGKTPGGNKLISDTLEALARHKQAAAGIAAAALNGDISPQEAERQLQALPDPLTLWKQATGAGAPTLDEVEAEIARRRAAAGQ